MRPCQTRARQRDLAERELLHSHCVPRPGIYDDFEANPASALLLLLAHNTSLCSFPALQRLNDPASLMAVELCWARLRTIAAFKRLVQFRQKVQDRGGALKLKPD